MSDNYQNRQIRIFISSTFRDMQVERDYLITKVFPKLRDVAAKRDVTVTALDLRWGITEEDSQSGKVLQVCLQEIENSHPFFIGLLGNRYGWCPTKEELQKNEILQERWGDWLAQDMDDGLSVTEMEMQYGVLRSKEEMNAYFFIRTGDEPATENADKLERLKAAVRNNGRYPVEDYCTAEELGQQVEKSFMELLNRLYPDEQLSPRECERLVQKAFLRSRTEVYIPNEDNYKVLDDFLHDSDRHHFVVAGESGMGKSALIANWVQRHEDDDDENIIYHFVGNGNLQGDYQQIAKRICLEIEYYYCIPRFGEDVRRDQVEVLHNRMITISGRHPLLIVLDGINQLADIDNAKLLNWLPYPPSNVKYLFSTLPEDHTMEVFRSRHYETLVLKPLDDSHKQKLIENYLHKYAKSITPKQTERIVRGSICQNTMVLRTLLDELVDFGYHERLDERIDYYLKAPSIETFYQYVLERYEEDFGADFVKEALGLIAYSKEGISESELLEIMGSKKQLQWSQLYCAIRSHLTVRGGLVAFNHQYIQEAAVSRYAADSVAIRKEIISLFRIQHTHRAFVELPHQYYELDDCEKLHRCLMNLDLIDYYDEKNQNLLARYWRKLLEERHNGAFGLSDYLRLNIQNGGLLNRIGSFIQLHFGDYTKALEYFSKAKSICEKESGKKHPDTDIVYNQIGWAYSYYGDYSKALEYFFKALDIREKVLGKEHPSTATSYNNIGFVFWRQRIYQKALEYDFKALSIYEKVLGNEHPDTANSYNSIGVVLDSIGDYPNALDLFFKALTIRKKMLGTEHPHTAQSYGNIGTVYHTLGDNSQALEYLNKALSIQEKVLGQEHPDIATSYSNIGSVYVSQGDYMKALEYYFKDLDICGKMLSWDHPDTAISYINIGRVYIHICDYPKALEYYQKAKAIHVKIYGPDHPQTQTVQESIDYINEVIAQNNQ